MNNHEHSGDAGRKMLLIIVAGVFLVYLLYPTKGFYWDGIFFAQWIEDASEFNYSLFHPNHLFYNVLGYFAFHAARFFNEQARALYVLQFINGVFGAASAGVFFLILKQYSKSIYLSGSLALLLAFSAFWWKFSTDADAYISSIFFLLAGFYFLFPDRPARPFLVALLHACAIFLHQLAVFFFPVAVLGLIFQTAALAKRERRQIVAQYALTAFSTTFATYYFCFYLSSGTFDFQSFIKWITFFSPENGFSKSIGESVSMTLYGSFRLFIEGRSGFLNRHPLTVVLTIILAVLIIALIVQAARNFRDIKQLWRTAADKNFYSSPPVLLCLVWTFSYVLFLLFFIPKNTFYRLFYLPALLILAGMLLSAARRNLNPTYRRRYRLALLAAMLAFSNFIFSIRPKSEILPDTPLAFAVRANQIWSDKTIIYYDLLDTNERYVRYFNPMATWKQISEMSPAGFQAEARRAADGGNDVWLEESAIEYLRAQTTRDTESIAALIEKPPRQLADKANSLNFIQVIFVPVQ